MLQRIAVAEREHIMVIKRRLQESLEGKQDMDSQNIGLPNETRPNANSQKVENLLNLALDATVQEREKSLELDTGYDRENNRWELIVKYNGNLSRLNGETIQVEELIAGYAIVTLPQSLIASFAELEEVEYIEAPKRLYFAIQQQKDASCIPEVTQREPLLSGKGTLVAVIDSGA